MRKTMIAILATLALSLSSMIAAAGKWSDKAQCDAQYETDCAKCRKIKPRLEMCWNSASERLAYCNRTGETGKPALLTGN